MSLFRIAPALVGGLLLISSLCPALADDNQDAVVIGSTQFTEQLILGNIYADVLDNRGVAVKKRLHLGSREVVFPALKSGEIDIMPGYTGALMAYLTAGKSKATRSNAVLATLRSELPTNILALKPASAQNKDALVVTRKTADQYDLQKVSDLKPVAGQLVLGGPPVLKTRADGIPGLKKVYDIDFKRFRALDAGGPLTQSALTSGAIDVARVFTTQGVIQAENWVVLKDDKNLVPAQHLIPLIREPAVTPKIRKSLNAVSAALSSQQLQVMNQKVMVDKQDPATVAHNWVEAHDL